jgi:hypothetical protein
MTAFEKWIESDATTDFMEASEKHIKDSKNMDMFKIIFEAGAQSERDKHRWIPITERLPEDDEHVLGLSSEKGVFICAYVSGYGWAGDSDFDPCTDIVAWQPLPGVAE